MTAALTGEMIEITPHGQMRLHLHSGQQRAWESEKRFVLVLAGSQSGKTVFGPHWLYREMQRQGPGDYMVVAPSLTILTLKAYPAFLQLFSEILDLGQIKVVNGRSIFTFSESGSIRTFGSYDPHRPTRVLFGYAAKPETLESATLLAVWADEAGMDDFKAGAWEAIRRRLSISRGRVLITTTPYNLGWLKQELYDPGVAGDPEIEVITFDSTENPAFPIEEYEERERHMPRWRFNMMYRGLFERPAGLIYDCFSRPLHVVSASRVTLDPTWPRFIGLDFGLLNFAALIFAKDPSSGRFYLYHEYHAGGFTMAEHVGKLLAQIPTRSDGTRARIKAIGGAYSEDRWRREIAKAGLQVERPDQPNVEVGIQRVYAAHKRNEILVLSNCTGYLDQKATYARKLDEGLEPTEDIKDKETYHFMDCERYVIGNEMRHAERVSRSQRFGRRVRVN